MNLEANISIYAGGPGSGCRGENCGRHKLAGYTKFQGMDISLEHKAGQIRTGQTRDGKKWKKLMMYDYGYFKRTQGVDGDHLDVYIGPHKDSQKVFVMHQTKADEKTYDEDKCFLGFNSLAEAKRAFYIQTKEMKGDRLKGGGITEYTIDEFKPLMKSTWENPRKLSDEKIAADAGEPQVYPGGLGHIEPMPSYHAPSIKNPKRVPTDDPMEKDDKFLDVTKRKERGTKGFRDRLSKKIGFDEKYVGVRTTGVSGFPSVSVGGFG